MPPGKKQQSPHRKGSGKKPIRRRHRLTHQEKQVLEAEYLKDPVWDRKRMRVLSKLTGYNSTKLYKWHYDRKRVENGYIDPRYQK